MVRVGTMATVGTLARRVGKLEAHAPAEALPRCYVLWDDDPLPAAMRAQDLVVRLARKAASVEAWVAQCRARGLFPPKVDDV